MQIFFWCCSVGLVLALAWSVRAEEPLSFVYKDGLKIHNSDKSFQAAFGAYAFNDWNAWWGADESLERQLGDLEDGANFRMARVFLNAKLYENFEFRAQYDFAGGDADFRDLYLGWLNLPFGNLRIGQYREPFGLEMLTGPKESAFLEFGLTQAFVPARNTGFIVYDSAWAERLTWWLGAFRLTNDYGEGSGNDEYGLTGRLSGLLLDEDGGRRLLHLGAAASYRRPNDDVLQYRQRPEVFNAPYFVDTGSFSTDAVILMGTEFALVLNSFSAQAEYMQARVEPMAGSDLSFRAYYGFVSYFITGEHRAYNRSAGAFGMLLPTRPYTAGGGGPGAWELTARYSYLDLTDAEIAGGKLADLTAGVNWYLLSNLRLMLNYTYADLKQVGGAHALQLRFQLGI